MKKLDVSRIASLCALLLGLERRSTVKLFRRNIPGFAGCAGLYTPKLSGENYFHRIYVSLEFCMYNEKVRGVHEVIAHELVHAYVVENHPRASTHGRTFQRKAAQLRKALKMLGVNVAPLYLKGVDK